METINFGEMIEGCFFWLIALYFYFLPSVIAFQKGSIMAFPILFLNLFLGWTLIIWVVCFIWACTTK